MIAHTYTPNKVIVMILLNNVCETQVLSKCQYPFGEGSRTQRFTIEQMLQSRTDCIPIYALIFNKILQRHKLWTNVVKKFWNEI